MWWNASEITPDTGEDVLVKVFEAPQGSASEGTPTGLTFLAQVKSIDAPGAHTDAVQIAYSLRTADLKDWEGHQPPVVLVIWDVSARIGYWLTVTDAIKRMEAGDAGWRAQKTVTAHVPLQNECNHAGLLRLRKLVADAVLPSVQGDRPLVFHVELFFPSSKAGIVQKKAFNDAIDRGIQHTIDAEFVRKVSYPDWFERLYGQSLPQPSSIEINSPSPPKLPGVTFTLEARSPGRLDTAQITTFVTRIGKKEAELSNASDESAPLWLMFVMRDDEQEIQLSLNLTVRFPREQLRAALLLDHLAAGASLRVVGSTTEGHRIYNELVGSVRPPPGLNRILSVLGSLSVIDQYLESSGEFNLGNLTDFDAEALKAIAEGLASGMPVKNSSIVIRAVDRSVLNDPTPVFRVNNTLSILGGRVHTANLEVRPVNLDFVKTAKERGRGMIDVELAPYTMKVLTQQEMTTNPQTPIESSSPLR